MSVNRDRDCIVRITQLPTTRIRDRTKLRAWPPTPEFSPGESYGQRSLAGYGSWGCREFDRTEESEYACMKLRADPTAKQFRINTEEAGGLEQRETEKHEPQPENKAKENATKHTGRVIDFDGSRGHFSHFQMSGEALRWGDSLKLTTSLLLGVFTKPSISAHPGPLMHVGENVIIRCHSPLLFDKFFLHQENSTGHFQRREEMLTRGHAPADFVIGPMTLASAGTYRCYGSLRRSPYVWSAPSDPVDIVIKGSTTSTCPSTMYPHTTEEALLHQEHSSTWYIGLGLVIAFTSTSIILAALVCHWFSTQNNVAVMEGEPNEGQTVNGEDPAAEDVIYAHLNHGTLSERLFTSAPLSPMHPFTEPVIYE